MSSHSAGRLRVLGADPPEQRRGGDADPADHRRDRRPTSCSRPPSAATRRRMPPVIASRRPGRRWRRWSAGSRRSRCSTTRHTPGTPPATRCRSGPVTGSSPAEPSTGAACSPTCSGAAVRGRGRGRPERRVRPGRHRGAPRLVDERTRMIGLTWIPTSGGLVNPAAEVGAVARDADVLYLLDATQAVGQLPIDVDALGCDLLTGTGRKFLARPPRGRASCGRGSVPWSGSSRSSSRSPPPNGTVSGGSPGGRGPGASRRGRTAT